MTLLQLTFLICIFHAVFCSPHLHGATPYKPIQTDPVLESWRWRDYPELQGQGLLSLTEAADGSMWFGVEDGAVCFDGFTWKTYAGDEGPYGPATMSMTGMKDGSVWAGTHHGISRFQDGAWQRMYPPEGDFPWPTFKIIEGVDGTVWAATDWGALRFDSGGVTLLTASDMASALKDLAPYVQTQVIPDVVVPHRKWWPGIGVDGARRSRGSVYRYRSPMVIWNIAPNSPGDRAGLKVGDRIVEIYNRQPRSQLDLLGRPNTPINIKVKRSGNPEPFDVQMTKEEIGGHYREFVLHDVYEDRDGNLWFGMAAGEFIRYGKDGTWRLFDAKDGMGVWASPSIYQDRKGVVWTLGYTSRQINRFDGETWTQITLPGGATKFEFIETSNNALWVVSWQSLNVLKDGEWKLYEWTDVPLPKDRLPDALLASDGALWLVSLRGYAVRLDLTDQWMTYRGLRYECTGSDGSRWFFDYKNERVVRQKGSQWQKYGVDDGLMDTPRGLLVTREGTVWAVGSHQQTGATAQFDNEQWDLEIHAEFAHYVPTDGFFQDAENNVWLGSPVGIKTDLGYQGGVLSYHPSAKTWTHHKPPNWPTGVYGMGQTRDGTFWFGGVMFRKHDGQHLMGVTDPPDFGMTFTDAVLSTADGDLWAGTRSEGVFRYDGHSWVRYDIRDGLAANRVTQILKTQDESVWVHTVDGISRFDGKTWIPHALPQEIGKEGIFGETLRQDLDGAMWVNWHIRRPTGRGNYTTRHVPDQSHPETEIISSFDRVSPPGNTSLRWRGADKWYATPVAELYFSWRLNAGEWSAFSKETSRDFLALPSGDYTFEVKARDLDFNEDLTPAIVYFTVEPPVYQQAWFVILMGVVIGITGLQAVRILSNNRQLRLANIRIQEADRAKSRFLANMSHELRTPLNGILGYTQILDRDPALGDKQRDGIHIIHRSGEHLLALINDVLDLSRIEAQKTALETTDFHLPTFLRGIADMTRIRAEQKGLSFHYDILTALPAGVSGDERRLRQVLINLLGNAVKFTDRGQVTFAVRAEEDRVHFCISDTGIGIAPGEVDTIFKPFEQVGDASYRAEGTGLGLTISHELVEMMGGHIQVKSKLSEGSEFAFEIVLPHVSGWESYREEKAHQPVGYEGERRSVLIVDDRLENRQVLTHLLGPLGFEVVEAEDGQEAVNKALENNPDLILMDLVMPTLDGFEATRRIKHALPDIPVIALSASVLDQNRQDSLAAGCDDFLPKPVDADLLFDKMASYLNLVWIFDTVVEQPNDKLAVIIPPQSVLKELDAFAQKGQIVALQEAVKNIEQLGEAYHPFAKQLHDLVDAFDLKGIRDFLRSIDNNIE